MLLAIPVLGVLDRTLFLVFRSEHYLSVLMCIALGPWIAGSKVVWLAIWWWAATSKLDATSPRWCVADAATGVRARGRVAVRDLLELQPWAERAAGRAVAR